MSHTNVRLSIAFPIVWWAVLAAPLQAAPHQELSVPEALRPWEAWALHEYPEASCPVVGDLPVCSWPGALRLDLTDTGGRFELDVTTDIRQDIPLPGDDQRWPEQVLLDNRAAPVHQTSGRPVIVVPPGTHRISGRFVWSGMPEGLPVPESIGRLSLIVNGAPIESPKREMTGHLWLSGAAVDDEADALSVSVMRRIADGVPLTVETRILLRVSGRPRELLLPGVLLPDTLPVSVTGPIPGRLDPEGHLTLQVRPGTHTVTVVARTEGDPGSLSPKAQVAPWPPRETWVFEADEALRQVRVTGAPGVDPSRTNLPDEWRRFPAYQVGPENRIVLETTRRGEPAPPPDQVRLSREMWLDLDGEGFTVRDRLHGTLNRSSRLTLAAPWVLGRVTVGGEDSLITTDPAGRSGVEVRNRELQVAGEWRLSEPDGDLPAVGWQHDVQHLDTTLYLPPGWELLFARGVDNVSQTWWDQWDLFSFFFVLIVAIAVGRLTRWYVGLATLATLVLTHHEPDAPMAVWVGVIIALALLKVVPPMGRLHTVVVAVWWAAIIWLAADTIPFGVAQIRQGLYPQVHGLDEDAYSSVYFSKPESAVPPAPPADLKMSRTSSEDVADAYERQEEQIAVAKKSLDIGSALSSPKPAMLEKGALRRARSSVLGSPPAQLTQDPEAVVQTGVGLPTWSWRRWALSWSGPVHAAHSFTLFLISPRVNLVLSLLRVLLVVLIALRLIQERRRITPPKSGPAPQRQAASAAMLLGVCLFGSATPAFAQGEPFPPEALIDELAARLTASPGCRPDCLVISDAAMSVAEDILTLTMTVNSVEKSAVPLPGPTGNWVPASVTIDGKETNALAVLTEGYLHARVGPGVSRVRVSGPLPPSDNLSLVFAMPPKRMTATVSGWMVDGLRADGRVTGAVQLTRQAPQADTDASAPRFDEGNYPPWLEVTRELSLGIPWIVTTTVRRLSPTGAPVIAAVPLLPGESVTASELEVKDQRVHITLSRDQEALSWSGTLSEQQRLALTAPEGVPWTEIWEVRCGPVWSCDIDGVAPVARYQDDALAPRYRPWPGEQLVIATGKPDSLEGVSVTIEDVRLSLSPGKRLVNTELLLRIRTSRGGEQTITLPTGATVQKVEMDGMAYPYRQEGSSLHVSLKTGPQVLTAHWQNDDGIAAWYQAQAVSLNRGAANVTVSIHLPRSRWLIVVGGPSWGPAVLFWGFLLAILLGGFVLGRARLSPLRSWQWMLLGLGLTQVPVPVILIIVGWFFLLAWRERDRPRGRFLGNTLQLGIAGWTAVALGCLVAAVYSGLAVNPDMQVLGNNSTGQQLNWYVDRIDGALPTPWVISVPIWAWKILMLGWALWLAAGIVKWGPWAFRAFGAGGYWQRKPDAPATSVTPADPPNPEAPPAEGK